MIAAVHVYEVRPRKDKRGVDLISDVLPFGRLWYDTADNAIGVYEIWLPFFSLVSLPKQLVTKYSQRNFTI